MSVSLHIAKRYLRSRRQSFFLSLVSVIAVVGIILGVAVLDSVMAIMNGFHAELRRTFVDNMPMITVMNSRPEGFTNLGAVLDTIGTHPQVEGAAPFIRQEVVLTSTNTLTSPRHKAAVAWGIVPSTPDVDNVDHEALSSRLKTGQDALVEAGLDRGLVRNRALLTPSCGTGPLTVPRALRAYDLLVEIEASYPG